MPEPDSLDIPFRITFEGGDADAHQLDFYDGTNSLFGFAKSLLLTTHYLINGEVKFQAPSARGARIYMLPSRQGSFEQFIRLVIDHPV